MVKQRVKKCDVGMKTNNALFYCEITKIMPEILVFDHWIEQNVYRPSKF